MPITAAGPDAISNVSVNVNGGVSVTAGSATVEYSGGSQLSNFEPTAYGLSFGYSQTHNIGTGSTADTVTVSVSVSVTVPTTGAEGAFQVLGVSILVGLTVLTFGVPAAATAGGLILSRG